MFQDLTPADETGLSLKKIAMMSDETGDIYHVTFDFQLYDAAGEFYEGAEIVIQVRGAQLGSKTVDEIENLAISRAEAVAASLADHIAAKRTA